MSLKFKKEISEERNESMDLEMPELEESEAMMMEESTFSEELLSDDFSQLDLDEMSKEEYPSGYYYESEDDLVEEALPDVFEEEIEDLAEEPQQTEIPEKKIKSIQKVQKETKEIETMTFAEKLRAINAQKEIEFKEQIEAEIKGIKEDIEKNVMENNIDQYDLNTASFEPKKKTYILTGLSCEGLIITPVNDKLVRLAWK